MPESTLAELNRKQASLYWLLCRHPDESCHLWRNDYWLCVDFETEKYAIWRRNGNVYRVQRDGEEYPGAVEDDPIYEPEGT